MLLGRPFEAENENKSFFFPDFLPFPGDDAFTLSLRITVTV
jgi:hypothetical protein